MFKLARNHRYNWTYITDTSGPLCTDIYMRFIEKIIKDQIAILGKYSGKDYGVLVHGNRMIELKVIKELDIKDHLEKINFEIDEDEVTRVTLSVIEKVKNFLNSNYPESILGTLFKNSTKCNHLIENI